MNKVRTSAATTLTVALLFGSIFASGAAAVKTRGTLSNKYALEFSQNDITNWDPSECLEDGVKCESASLPEATIKMLESAGVKEKAEQNKERYQYAEKETGLPWQVVAALHYREGGMDPGKSVSNGQPLTGGGCYTNVDGVKICSDPNEDAKQGAEMLISGAKSVYDVDVLQNPGTESYGWAFLAYNRGAMYKCHGNVSYEKSPYVMNYLDSSHQDMVWIEGADTHNCNGERMNNVGGSVNKQVGALAVLSYLGGLCGGGDSCSALGEARTKMWQAASDYDKQSFMKTVSEEDHSLAGVEGYMNQVIAKYGSDGTLANWLDGQCEKFRPTDASCRGDHAITSEEQKWIDAALNGSNKIHFAVGNATGGSSVGAGKIVCVWDGEKCRDDVDYTKEDGKGVCSVYSPSADFGECWGLEGAESWASSMESSCGSSSESSSGDTVSDPSTAMVSGNNITWIGDSYSTGAQKIIEEKFSGISFGGTVNTDKSTIQACKFVSADTTCNANPTNPSGFKVLEDVISKGDLKQYLVFALGTNGGWTDADITKFKEIIKDQNVKVILVNSRTPNEDFSASNERLKNLASENDNIFLADWVSVYDATYFTGDPEKIHPVSSGGYEKWVSVISDALSSAGGDCGGQNPVVEVDGNKYMFPLAGAAKDNYLQPGNGPAGESVLSPLPCKDYTNGSCHHDYFALDMGLRKSKIDGSDIKPSDYPDLSGYTDMYYYSTGVKALAFVEGEITNYSCYKNSVPNGYDSACKCASISYKGVDGISYWIGHLSYDSNIKTGDKFNLGDQIGEIGPPPCAQGTQAHIHVDVQSGAERTKILDIMNATFNALPETNGGSSGVCASDDCPRGDKGQVNGGLSESQAEKLRDYYNSDAVSASDWGLPFGKKNCVSFSMWFVQALTSIGKNSAISDNGNGVAHNTAKVGNLEEGTEPRPYSVFSVTDGITICEDGNKCGHTGIVVGVDGDDILTVEAAYPDTLAYVSHRSKSYFVNTKYTNSFTYLDSILDKSALAEIVGN